MADSPFACEWSIVLFTFHFPLRILDLRLRVTGLLLRGLPYFGAISLGGDGRLSKRDASTCCKEEALFCQADIGLGML